jgi:3-oxoacyl-[acyl-carrier-protein] synthase II
MLERDIAIPGPSPAASRQHIPKIKSTKATNMFEHDVVITGVGLISAGARSPQELFERIKNGDSCVSVIDELALLGFQNPVAAAIDNETWAWLKKLAMPNQCDWESPSACLTLTAADQAMAASGLAGTASRAGVFTASNRAPMDADDLAELVGALACDNDCVDLDRLSQWVAQKRRHGKTARRDQSALLLADRYGFHDAVMTSEDACAAGSIAIGTAYRHIRHGELDVAIAGGTELLCEFLPFLCFNGLGLLTQGDAKLDPSEFCRPFDSERHGFVLGEGSAFLILESAEHARARGAKPLARIAGFTKQSEAGSVLASSEDGSEFARCMLAALEDAGLAPEDIDHINAHGTSTLANDAAESRAISRVFGERAGAIPVTANKGATGHSLGASGAIEAVLSVLSLIEGTLLPTLNYQTPDPSLPSLNLVTQARQAPIKTIISNSFGMGGENCSLILKAA